MTREGSSYDRKSLRAVTGRTADWHEVVKDAVAFANAKGGVLDIGIEDDAIDPPTDQVIPADLPDTIRRRVRELTVNVDVLPELCTAADGSGFVKLNVPRSTIPAGRQSSGRRHYAQRADRLPSRACA